MTSDNVPTPKRKIAVYAWLTGQDFNVGDSLLRRPYLRELSRMGPVNAWVRDASDAFLTGLGTERATKVERSFGVWFRDALKSVLRSPTLIALNAGEIRRTRGGAVRIPAMALLGLLAKIRGGGAVWLGSSIARGDAPKIVGRLYGASAASMSFVRWREAGSLKVCAAAHVGPDWAFAEGTDTSKWQLSNRNRVAFVLRGDRGRPSSDWVAWARAAVENLELEPVFVVQVRGDEALAHELVAELGGSVLEWAADATHAEQEALTRSVYATAALVIGDRLHGLIIGATEGAVPLGWVESSSWKIRAHFDAVGMEYVGAHEGKDFDAAPALDVDSISNWRAGLTTAIDAAREKLDTTVPEISRKLRSLR